ncbi:MAG: response regulator [Acidobacteriota bacterium]
MQRKILVADIDTVFLKELKAYCNPSRINIEHHTKGEELLTHIGIEEPTMVFLSLDLPDVNDFIVFDILKRYSDPNSPSIYIIYSDSSEGVLNSVRKLKFTAEGYLKKPVSKSDLSEIIKKNLDPDSYLIPSEMITMKDILNDDDIMDLGSEDAGLEDGTEILSEDLFVDTASIDPDEASDAGTNTEIKQILVESVEDIPDLPEPQEFGDSPFQVDDQNDLENISTDFQSEIKEKEKEFEQEKKSLMEEMTRIRERETRSDEEKKKLLRDIETSEIKLRELDEEREQFSKKLDTLSTDYEKRIEDLHEKYKNKMKKFEDMLKKSLTEINED